MRLDDEVSAQRRGVHRGETQTQGPMCLGKFGRRGALWERDSVSGGSEVWINASDWRRAAAVVREQNIRRRREERREEIQPVKFSTSDLPVIKREYKAVSVVAIRAANEEVLQSKVG